MKREESGGGGDNKVYSTKSSDISLGLLSNAEMHKTGSFHPMVGWGAWMVVGVVWN